MKAIGIELQGQEPTTEERERLEAQALEKLGTFTTKVVKYYDPASRKSGVRLDAYQTNA